MDARQGITLDRGRGGIGLAESDAGKEDRKLSSWGGSLHVLSEGKKRGGV